MEIQNLKLLLVSALLLSSCAKIDLENPIQDSKQVQQRATPDTASDLIQIEVHPKDEAEKYTVHFTWPPFNEDYKIRIRDEKILSTVSASQLKFSHDVTHNQDVIYSFDILDSNNHIYKSFSKKVTIPRDYVVRENENILTEDKTIQLGRLYLSKTPLLTFGHNIHLQVDTIYSDEGKIESFPQNTKADQGKDGRHGGNLMITANRAIGNLKITMRGENGGDGIKGASYASRAQDGMAPTEGHIVCECVKCPKGHKTVLAVITPMRECGCGRLGQAGQSGRDGEKGKTGGRSGDGGNSGVLKAHILDGGAFQILAEAFNGVSGNAGLGGDGQDGGIALDGKGDCSGPKGSNGQKGPQGDLGEKGRDGMKELLCIYIESEKRNECF